jgi:hypothetical protein
MIELRIRTLRVHYIIARPAHRGAYMWLRFW